MSIDDITAEESLFQPRDGISTIHVAELARTKRNVGDLDPVLVIQVGPKTILLDGHHRLEVYKADEKEASIPVRFFSGSLEGAIEKAGDQNVKVSRQMNSEERLNWAWRRTVLGIGSIARVSRGSGVSQRTVAEMRRVRDAINAKKGRKPNAKAGFYATWKEARRAVQGDEQRPDFDYEDHMTQKAQVIAEKLYKSFGTAFTSSPLLTAKVLEIMFGDRLVELQTQLRDVLEGEDEDESEDEVEEIGMIIPSCDTEGHAESASDP
ncbi:hypothetical protein [Microvirga brassicacearum]|uniref:ParB-like N-terminal domain-containing protein n=1 Tax=Microvirga brassicacearum TaxID=2580413 RepID=A0A5N3P8G7_9HYPH|nr:hypothetical protein [Microvirga brassicacearum]KAB0266016.1 hypothetical protein FEZ63_16455 [Microvirga brassicacearum]